MLIQKTLNMANATGYVVTLNTNKAYASVQIRSGVACYLKSVDFNSSAAAPTAPVATPAPGAGNIADYYHMAAGETIRIGLESTLGAMQPTGEVNKSATDAIQYLVVWSEGAGDLVINAH